MPSYHSRYVLIPRDLYIQAKAALGPQGGAVHPVYTAAAIEHFCVGTGGIVYIPDDSPPPPDTGRKLGAPEIVGVLQYSLARREAARHARHDTAPAFPPRVLSPAELALPVVIDDPSARAWRWCRCCWALFHTLPGRPGQLYDTQACGRLAHAWVVYALQAPRRRDQAIPTPAAVEMFGWRRFTTRWYGHRTHRALIRRTRAAERQQRLSQRVQTWWRRHR